MRDDEILTRFERRDEQAIPALAAQYGAYCRKIAAALLPNPEDCEECLNDVWNQAWQTLPRRRPQQLRAYLAAITRNTAKNRRDALGAQKRGGDQAAVVFEELGECVEGGESAEAVVMAKALAEEINRFLRTLPPRERDIFLRRYYFVESIDEIAARFRLRESNVRVILSRTRKKLKKHLTKEGFFE